MATFKAIVLPHEKRQDNTYNIKNRVVPIHSTLCLPEGVAKLNCDMKRETSIRRYNKRYYLRNQSA